MHLERRTALHLTALHCALCTVHCALETGHDKASGALEERGPGALGNRV